MPYGEGTYTRPGRPKNQTKNNGKNKTTASKKPAKKGKK